jgi:hypothetical protein
MVLKDHKSGEKSLFADPQSITINSVATTFPRMGADLDHGIFRTTDGAYSLDISHVYGKRTRRTARIDYKVLAPDVMDSSVNTPYSASCYMVMDTPQVGISRAQAGIIAGAFFNWASASSYAALNKFLDGES